MSLATRCTACHTVFRVVQDQLKVSEGWVRCGRCQAVFNALEGLFDLEPPLPPPEPPPAPAPVVAAEEPPAPRAPPAEPDPPPVSRPIDFDETPASRVAARDRNDFADAQFNSALLAEAGIEGADDDAGAPAETALTAAATTTGEGAPEFVRQAERQARRERPLALAGLALLCLALLLGLGLQAAFHFRDLLAATTPALRPALEAMCNVLACRIEPLRRIDDIVIESSTLAAAPGGEAVRLSLVLRNRGALPLAMPSIELTLTDAGGQMLARRALAPADFAVSAATLQAGSEQALQLVMSTGSRRASGYTVEPFYP